MRYVADGIRSTWNLPVGLVAEGSQQVIPVTRKLKTLYSMLLVGFPFRCHRGRWQRCVVAGVLNEVRQSGVHASKCSVIDCDGYIERTFLSIGNT